MTFEARPSCVPALTLYVVRLTLTSFCFCILAALYSVPTVSLAEGKNKVVAQRRGLYGSVWKESVIGYHKFVRFLDLIISGVDNHDFRMNCAFHMIFTIRRFEVWERPI